MSLAGVSVVDVTPAGGAVFGSALGGFLVGWGAYKWMQQREEAKTAGREAEYSPGFDVWGWILFGLILIFASGGGLYYVKRTIS